MDDNASGIHFSAKRERHMSGSSSVSLQSMVGTISRVNTVASALKRFLSRDSGNSVTPEGSQAPGKSASAISLQKLAQPGGSMKITDQVIEEVDEQMTITSQKHDHRPTAFSVFHPSQPIDIPTTSAPDYMRTLSVGLPLEHVLPPGGVDALLSSSAPMTGDVYPEPRLNLAETIPSSDTLHEEEQLDYNVPVDEFELLKARREQERLEKQKATVARTISTAPVNATVEASLDTLQLLENLNALAKEEAALSTSPSTTGQIPKTPSETPSDAQL